MLLNQNMWICGLNIDTVQAITPLKPVVANPMMKSANVSEGKSQSTLFQRLFSRRNKAGSEQGSQTETEDSIVDIYKNTGGCLPNKSDLTVSFSLPVPIPVVPGFTDMGGKLHWMFGSGSKGDLTKLTGRELVNKIRMLDGWMGLLLKRPCLHREFVFANLNMAVMFVYVVSAEANIMRHYPKINMLFNRVSVTLRTALVDGITNRDIALAQAINGMANILSSGANYK
jgi:4a-hydroxytetrahydrobiopterin dehydratase